VPESYKFVEKVQFMYFSKFTHNNIGGLEVFESPFWGFSTGSIVSFHGGMNFDDEHLKKCSHDELQRLKW
jgi:hypothetical protein